MEPAAVVIDNGTGYTKMGYAGNMEPSYMIPSVIATAKTNVSNLFDTRIFEAKTKHERHKFQDAPP